MFLIHCPHCGETREEEEFAYGGEAFIARPDKPDTIGDEAWGDYLFMRKNPKGWHWEMWGHATGCRKWFVVKRHTATHGIQGSWTLGEGRKVYDAEASQLASANSPPHKGEGNSDASDAEAKS